MNAVSSTARRRVEFIFPRKTIEVLDRLKGETGASSRTEVLKPAIELLRWTMIHLSRGEEILETIAIPGAHFPGSASGGTRR